MESKVVLAIYVNQIGLINAYACVCMCMCRTVELPPAKTTHTPGNYGWGPSLQYGLASKSSLPCPGEEAPPLPKSLVGVGTWGLQVIALGPRRRLLVAVPSAARGDTALPTSGSGGRGRDQRPRSRSRKCGGCGQWAPVDRPRAAVVPPPQPGVTGSLPVPAL